MINKQLNIHNIMCIYRFIDIRKSSEVKLICNLALKRFPAPENEICCILIIQKIT